MNHDDIELLRRANPVPHDVSYADDEIASRVADLADPDRVMIPLVPAERRPRGRLVPAVAAAVVVLVAVVAAVLLGRTHDSGTGPASSMHPVTCSVSTDDGAQATRARETQAAQAISTRLNGGATEFNYDATAGTVSFTPTRVSQSAAAQACSASSTSVRSLVTNPVTVDTTGERRAHPLAALGFAIPDDESGYSRLAPDQQHQLATAMSHFDCSANGNLACSTAAGIEQVYLLGGRIIGSTDVATAQAEGPTLPGTQWTVVLTLQPSAASRLSNYTAQHHSAATTGAIGQCGSASGLPCADYLALVADGSLVSAPQVASTLSGTIQIAGSFTEGSARALAADYTAAAIGLRAG